ncbi:MAG TPA: hypothetical protein VFW21_11280 [Mycobacterium sp.]|nr:hypothetical protein [Mycobacterium sp.]
MKMKRVSTPKAPAKGSKGAAKRGGAAALREDPLRRPIDGAARRRPVDGPGRRRPEDAPQRDRRAAGARVSGPTREQRPPRRGPAAAPVTKPSRPKNTSQAKARAKARKAKAPKVVRVPLRERLINRLARIDLNPRTLIARVPFVVLVIASLGLGLGVTLWLSTDAAERSYQLGHARVVNQALQQQKESLERQVLEAQAAPALAEAARNLGMIPSRDTAHLVQDPSGNWVVIGKPKPAEGVPPPPLNFKLGDPRVAAAPPPPAPAPPPAAAPPAAAPPAVAAGQPLPATPPGSSPEAPVREQAAPLDHLPLTLTPVVPGAPLAGPLPGPAQGAPLTGPLPGPAQGAPAAAVPGLVAAAPGAVPATPGPAAPGAVVPAPAVPPAAVTAVAPEVSVPVPAPMAAAAPAIPASAPAAPAAPAPAAPAPGAPA